MICNVPVCDSDIDEPIVIVPTSNTIGKEYVGTSQTDKPTGVQQYSIYHELDTGKNYYYDNGQWNEIPCCSGGGGGGTGTTWHVIVNAVSMADTMLTAERLETEGDGGVHLDVIPFYNEVPFYSLNLPVDDGLTDVGIDLHVYDSYTGDVPATIKVYYNASYTAEVTGNITATHDEYDFIFTVTGDGTITITAA